MGRNSRKDIDIKDRELKRLIETFCTNVIEKRQSSSLTQQQFANKAGLSVNTIAEIEQKRIENLRLSTITAIGKALGIKPLKLLEKNKDSL